MTMTWRLYSCDDHLDLWNLPRDVWEDRLPASLRERGPRVVEQGESAWWTCDGTVMGMHGLKGEFGKAYSAIGRAGIEDDGLRASNPALRLQDMEREHVLEALARHDGNREATAEELGISVRTLYYRLKEYARQGYSTGSSRT